MATDKKGKKGRAGKGGTSETEKAPAPASEGAAAGAAPAKGNGGGAPEPAPAAPEPGKVLPPKVAPKLRVEHSLGPDPVAETANKGLEQLRENWQAVAAAVLLVVVAALFVTWRGESARSRNRLAWQQFHETTGEKDPPPEKLQELLDRYAGTDAEPFILLRLGDVHLARGKADDTNKALEIYNRVLKDFGSNETAAGLARSSVEAATKALNFDPAKHAEKKGEKVEWAKGAEPAGK